MKVTVVAHTQIVEIPEALEGTEFTSREDWSNPLHTADIDLLGELTGRGCYKSWKMPNPKTAVNEGYLGNILEQGHYSVMEHGSVTFYVEDVSRALLLELERHRHISFSVESQRFVDTRKNHPEAVVPPAIAEPGLGWLADLLQQQYRSALHHYDIAYKALRDQGLSVKQSREAARAFLLESTPVDFFVTGNVRAWRDVLFKRHSMHADAEIQEFSKLILDGLLKVAPNSMQDISTTPSE